MDISFIVKNKKKIIVGVIILLILLIGQSLVNSTYSLFYHEDTAANTDAYSTGLLSIIASSKGENISLGNALPMSDSEGETTTPYTFTIKNIGNLDYKFDVKLLSTADSDITIDSRYIKVKVDDGSPATLSSLSNSIIKSDITLASGESIDISIRVWLSSDTPNTQIGKVFNSKIVTDGQAVYTSSNNPVAPALVTLNYLNNLNSTIILASDTPDFTTVSGSNGTDNNGNTGLGDGTKGIYAAEDDLGTSYYFRGAVDNNYVKFANFYWRIIRINGDGSIRMIYAGTSAHANGESETDSHIGTSAYNVNYQDNGYFGYMYGNFTIPTNCSTNNNVTICTGGSTSYEEAHANINDSTIKTFIDEWYNNNLKDYAYAIADTIYCNDRSVTPVESFAGLALTGTGKGIENTAYSGLTRGYISHNPSLKCVNKNDIFTVKNSIGNAKLTNPIALITSDEVIIGGLSNYDFVNNVYILNPDSYLTTPNYWYWTLTPFFTAGGSAIVYYVGYGFLFGEGIVNNDGGGVRPVVSLSSDAITGGSGTMNNPFTVG